MARWMRLAGMVAVLAIGESCGLKPPAVPHLELRSAAQPAPTSRASAVAAVARSAPTGPATVAAGLPKVRLPSP